MILKMNDFKAMIELKTILEKLIEFPSITPKDEGCQAWMMSYLSEIGFICESYPKPPVSNFFARFGTEAPLLILAGHSDVVPTGELGYWNSPPFSLLEKNEKYYGRGVADMKGSLAAMLLAAKRFTQKHPSFKGSLGFLITSGEEGDDFLNGTPYVLECLKQKNIRPDYCILGEPSSENETGDMIKVGRRGSLTGKLLLSGKQGHVAYPHLAKNPIHQAAKVLATLVEKKWDEGNAYFQPTSFQITHIQAGGQANNIIPQDLHLHFNFRFSTEQKPEQLQSAVELAFQQQHLNPKIKWQLSGLPFLSTKGRLLSAVIESIQAHKGQPPTFSTSGGTSDGRFIAPYGIEIVELGPVNASIHQINEWVNQSDLESLLIIYEKIFEKIFI